MVGLFQCRGVALIGQIIEQGPTVPAAGVVGCLDIFAWAD